MSRFLIVISKLLKKVRCGEILVAMALKLTMIFLT